MYVSSGSLPLLLGRKTVSGNIVVIGGGLVGLEVAEYLSERGCSVTVLEMRSEVAADMGSIRKICVKESLYINKVKEVTKAKVVKIEKDAVIAEVEGKLERYPCDGTVVAIGVRSKDATSLEAVCREEDIPYFSLGDAAKARRAINAIAEPVLPVLHRPYLYRRRLVGRQWRWRRLWIVILHPVQGHNSKVQEIYLAVAVYIACNDSLTNRPIEI